jgi:hypothetical protein
VIDDRSPPSFCVNLTLPTPVSMTDVLRAWDHPFGPPCDQQGRSRCFGWRELRGHGSGRAEDAQRAPVRLYESEDGRNARYRDQLLTERELRAPHGPEAFGGAERIRGVDSPPADARSRTPSSNVTDSPGAGIMSKSLGAVSSKVAFSVASSPMLTRSAADLTWPAATSSKDCAHPDARATGLRGKISSAGEALYAYPR